MIASSVGFIGGGRVARILLGGWATSRKFPQEVVLSDPDESVLARLKEAHPQVRTVPNGNQKAASQNIVFLAVHPPAIADAAASAKSAVSTDTVVVSLAPKITMARLAELFGGFGRLARVIPNAPSVVGEGFNPIVFGEQLPAGERRALSELLGPLCECPVVSEEKLEPYAIVTAMSPTYFWPQLYELQSLAESFGLSAAEAREGIRQSLCGALATMFDSGLDRAAVEDLIPVKPLADLESPVREAYRARLPALLEKIRPQA